MQDIPIDDTRISQKKTLRDRGICVIIPTYDNCGTIVDIVKRAQNQCSDVIVVSDGCTDGTVDLLNAMDSPPTVIELKRNCGKGAALRAGFRYALAKGFAYAITIDGDGQHYPEDLPSLLDANMRHPGAIIVGERKDLDTVERSKGSRFANSFSNFWFFVQTGRRLKDTQTGYRLYPLKHLRGLSLLTSRYEAELELMVFASWHGVKLFSEPVRVYYPPREERVSHFRPGMDFLRISILNIVLTVLAVVYGLPLRLFNALRTPVRTFYCLLFFLFNIFIVLLPSIYVYLHIGEITEKKRHRLHRIICKSAEYVLIKHGIPGVRYSQDNRFSEDFSKPSLIICNHQSHLDLLPVLMQTDRMVVLTNDWAWNNPFYGYIIRNADFLPTSLGFDQMLSRLQDLKFQGYSIVVFPEGTRSLDCSIGRFHRGAIHLAKALELDILPMIVYGTGKVLPKHGRAMHRWPVHFEIDRRIPLSALSEFGDTPKEQSSALRRYYIRRYSEIANRIEQNV